MLISHVLALTMMFEFIPPPQLPHDSPHGSAPHGPPPVGLLLDIGIRLAAIVLAAWVGARWLSDPVRRLAGAARELGNNIHGQPMQEVGTRECRDATRVFNQMQQKIREQLDQRDQFVAAVSHDLRTPLTRLALRAESLNDAAERQRFGKDIAEMDAMIRATLDYLRGAAEPEAWVALDLASLVDSLVQDNQDCGHDVQADVPDGVCAAVQPLQAQASALRRCIGNVLDNAVRYGGGARVSIGETMDTVCIHIDDHGPGIPEAELRKVLQPFYRLEGSRNRNSGGVGLGLAVASDIARQHGGWLDLSNRLEGGLRVSLVLLKQ
jgi:protein-histidine pros-kinase